MIEESEKEELAPCISCRNETAHLLLRPDVTIDST
jgi:hypothetical protein